mgnify:CR=1 FL=1
MTIKVFVHLEGESIGIGGLHTSINNQRKAIRRSEVLELVDSPFEADVIHINNIGISSNLLVTLKHFNGVKVVIHAHSLLRNITEGFSVLRRFESAVEKLLKTTYKRGDVLIAPSQFCAEGVKKLVDGSVPIKSFSNGIDLEKYEDMPDKERMRKKYNAESPVICSVGNAFERKGVKEFIELGKEFPDRDFFWFGPIQWTAGNKIKELIESSPKNVRFTGRIKNILEAYSLADIFLFPSRQETQGLVLLEAAASSLPIVVRDLPAYTWIEGGKECLKSSNLEELKQNTRRFLEDPELREKFSRNARKLAERHSIDELRKDLEKTYIEVMK